MKNSLHNRLSAIEKRKESDRIDTVEIVYVGCRCGRDYPELFTTVPTPEKGNPEPASNQVKGLKITYAKEVPIDSVTKCVDPENAYDRKCRFGLPLE
jgi:hypothetical protein